MTAIRRTGRTAFRALTAALISAALLTAGGCLDLSGRHLAHKLQRNGTAADAEIVRVWDTGISINDDHVIGMDVLVHPPDNQAPYSATIKRTLIGFLDVPKFQPGRVIPIRFDPKEPQRVAYDDAR